MNRVVFSSASFYWNTPLNVFNELNHEFKFTLDPCSSSNNLGLKYYNESDDGLTKSWKNEIVFCNPPYKYLYSWVSKSYYEWNNNGSTVVLLIPARTDTKWFHKYILPYCEIRFIEGRLKFNNSKNNAPFPSMICIFRSKNEQ